MNFKRISIIGTGKVAGFLAHKIREKGFKISNIYGRNFNKASELAVKVDSKAVKSIVEVVIDTDLLIIAVNDGAINQVVSDLGKVNCAVVHTSGMESGEVLQNISDNYGKLYPLQSITPLTDLKVEVPICVYGNNESFETDLSKFSNEIFGNSFPTKPDDFPLLHLSAVLVNNFTNALFAEAFDLLNKNQIDQKVLLPLIQETFRRIENHSPVDVQTGPAVRNDIKTIQKHLDLLTENGNPDLVKIYELMSKLIQNQKSK